MTKKNQKKTPVQELNERLQKLTSQRIKAYQSGASHAILAQLERMIEETQLELYTESELERYRNNQDDQDGEQWIV